LRTFGDEIQTTNDLEWIILSATSRFVGDRTGRREPREIKRGTQTKFEILKQPRASSQND
jgi:hypothetical protein